MTSALLAALLATISPTYRFIDSTGESVEVVLIGSNLLDERYPLSPDADAPLAPGRSVALTLQACW